MQFARGKIIYAILAALFVLIEQYAMDRLDVMRLYTRIVDRRSFTLAAQDLQVPRSTATQVIKELETRLGVFEGFQPKLSERSRSSDVLFLANIQPDLQREVRAQLPEARFVALDSMNLWIDIARDSLVSAIESVDCVILNDAELRQLTGKPNLLSAARELLSWNPSGSSPAAGGARGPSVVIAKQGEYGAALITRESFFALPAYPLETVIDPTGAGDTFAGGLVGYIAAHPGMELSDELLRGAMAHATVLASFNVEEFGTERVERLTGQEIAERIDLLREITRFSGSALQLRN